MVIRRRAIADTSFLIGVEAARLPEQLLADYDLGISSVTLGELRLGVLSASNRGNPVAASRRLATYQLAQKFDPIPVDGPVSEVWALLVAQLRAEGSRVPINDTWIAATALAYDLPVVTQDTDYSAMPGVTTITV